MIIASNALIRRAGPARGVVALINGFKMAALQRRAYTQTVRELSELGPRELDDLGISRGEIRAIAHASVYGTRQQA